METLTATARADVLAILAGQPDLTLATIRPDGYPQATTVSFAHDGLTIYIGVGLDSQKMRNIRHSDKVSLAITPPYTDWQHIRGLSLAGRAAVVVDDAELRHAAALMTGRFPQLRQMMSEPGPQPWAGNMALLRIEPEVISVLDYTRGFGHTDIYRVTP
ncbi:pyridoxamine 5'-phosphate oxidase family protein [Rugamonas sp. A1-17]|nr:pyridoxamine 5'-phosphate oxidase family protein [Rugamonas sp. A1-17]